MAKPRRNYYKKKPTWQWIIFYLVIVGIILALLYYSGVLGFGGPTNPSEQREVQYFQ